MPDTPDMSDSEKFEAQGRAHAALKAAKSNVATIRATLTELSRELRDVAGEVDQLLRNPSQRSPSFVPVSAHVKDRLQYVESKSATARRLVDELMSETDRVQDLQRQVDEF